MTSQFLANLLGVNQDNVPALVPQFRSPSTHMGHGSFADTLASALSGNGGAGGMAAAAIVTTIGTQMAALLHRISLSTDVGERRALAQEFRDQVISALREAGHTVSEGSSPDKIVVDGQLYDILRSLNSPGAEVAAQYLPVEDGGGNGGGPTAAISSVVYGVGSTHGHLLAKMNAATTVEERLQWAVDLRDAVIAALQGAGYNAFEIGKADKIVVEGTIYDILRAVDGVGMQTALQLLPVGTYGENGSGDPRAAILSAGAPHSDLLARISGSNDLDERRSVAEQLRQLVIDALRAAGFDAQACSGPDKLVVDGVTYDFIRSLNSPGVQVYLQALVVA